MHTEQKTHLMLKSSKIVQYSVLPMFGHNRPIAGYYWRPPLNNYEFRYIHQSDKANRHIEIMRRFLPDYPLITV